MSIKCIILTHLVSITTLPFKCASFRITVLISCVYMTSLPLKAWHKNPTNPVPFMSNPMLTSKKRRGKQRTEASAYLKDAIVPFKDSTGPRLCTSPLLSHTIITLALPEFSYLHASMLWQACIWKHIHTHTYVLSILSLDLFPINLSLSLPLLLSCLSFSLISIPIVLLWNLHYLAHQGLPANHRDTALLPL